MHFPWKNSHVGHFPADDRKGQEMHLLTVCKAKKCHLGIELGEAEVMTGLEKMGLWRKTLVLRGFF